MSQHHFPQINVPSSHYGIQVQSMDDNELISPGESGNLGENGTKLKINGANHVEDVTGKLHEEKVVSPSVTVVSLEGTGSSSSTPFPAVNKRQGLKKWRRIPREFSKKTGSNLNCNENEDLSVSPVPLTMLNITGGHPVQPEFAIRADSDRSGRSSAAANYSRMRNEISNLNVDNSFLVLPDDHQRNDRIESGKKARGFNIEKENSNSNSNSTMGIMGSDSGSSNFVFVQGSKTVASRGRQSGSSAKHKEESSGFKDLNEEIQTAFIKRDAGSDDVSVAAENIEKHEGSMEHNPLIESIKGLHSVQEEFEREVQKWRDVGKDDPLISTDPIHEILELKNAKILELELALSSGGIKTDLEDCLMKMIQADVENVVLTTTTKRLAEGPLREIKHNLQQKNISSQGVQVPHEPLETKENLKKLQHRACRFTSCFLIQLILMLVTLYLKFSPQNVEVVPT